MSSVETIMNVCLFPDNTTKFQALRGSRNVFITKYTVLLERISCHLVSLSVSLSFSSTGDGEIMTRAVPSDDIWKLSHRLFLK